MYAASQWAVLSLIAKLGNSEMLGQYALAVAVASPIAMFSHLNLRAVLATDMEHQHPFGDYLVVRIGTIGLALFAIAAVVLAAGYAWPVAAATILVGLSISIEAVSDIYYALLQRREQMSQIAWSMGTRGILSVLALGCALWFTRDLVAAVAALVLVRVTMLFVYDRPKGSAGECLSRTGSRSQVTIFRTALPLGVVLLLVSLTTNVPRYAIARYLGTRELGAFAAVASFITVGRTVVNALGQAATPRLARFFSEKDLPRFRRLALQLTGLALLLGMAGVLFALLIGKAVLGLLYRPEYGAYSGLMVAVMAAGIATYMASVMGYIITSARSFAEQMPLLGLVTGSAAAASWLFVPVLGLSGGALAIAVAGCVQTGGSLLILRRALRRRERAA